MHDGLAAPGVGQRLTGSGVGGSSRVSGKPAPGLGGVDDERDAVRPQALEVAHERRLRLERVLLGMDAAAHLGSRVGHDRVHGAVDGQRVDSSHGERRTRPDPLAELARPQERHVRQRFRERPELLVGVRRAGPRLAREALDRNVAVLVVHGRERADEREQRVRRGAAELTAVLRAGERPRLDGNRHHPAQRDRERRDAGPHAAHVADHHRVRVEQLRTDRREGRERTAANLLLTLDHDLDADRRLPTPGADRTDVHEDVRFRIGRAPAVDRAVPFGRLEWRRVPLVLVADRNDVVVAVEQDRGRALGRGDLSEHHRRGVGQLERIEDRHARIPEQADYLLVRLEEGGTRLGRIVERRDRRDGDKTAEVFLEAWHQLGDLVPRRAAHGYMAPRLATAARSLNEC